MKRLFAILVFGLSAITVQAGPYNHGHHGHGHRHIHNPGWWIAPTIVGGVVTYAITRPVQAVPPVVVYPNTLPPAPLGYHYEQLLDANCNCYRWVLVSN